MLEFRLGFRVPEQWDRVSETIINHEWPDVSRLRNAALNSLTGN